MKSPLHFIQRAIAKQSGFSTEDRLQIARFDGFSTEEKPNRKPRLRSYQMGALGALSSVAAVILSSSIAQAAPVTLQFTGAVCETNNGSACLAQGSVWRFSNVIAGAAVGSQRDALVTITTLSGGATLATIDDTANGIGTRFQPSIVSPNTANITEYAKFNIKFVAPGTTNVAAIGGEVYETAFDVDGDGNTGTTGIREFVEFGTPVSSTLASSTLLTTTNSPVITSGGASYIVALSASSQSGIGTGNDYKVTALYNASTTNFDVILGGKTGSAACNPNCARLSSVSFDVSDVVPLNDVVVAKTHTGNFSQGQTGATYSLTVRNYGAQATSGTVTVIDTIPTGLTATAASGTGWTCTLNTPAAGQVQCTRSDALAAGSSYPPITLTVNVANTAPSSVTNSATISGGGDYYTNNNTATDPTTINGVPDLTVSKSHTGNFTYGSTASYSINVGNAGRAGTSSAITLTDTLPTGLTVPNGTVTLTGTNAANWTCIALNNVITCTSATAIAASGNSTFNLTGIQVGAAAVGTITNTVTVSGGGETNTANNSASDLTIIDSIFDYGDAPNTYGTLLANNGARHSLNGLYLGAGVTNEADGQPSATASADTNDDGVTFSPSLGANYSTLIQAGISNQVKVVSSGAGFVNAWVDYNQNGVFDTGEQILTNVSVVAGTNTLTFTPSNTVRQGPTFARIRLSPTSVASPSPVGLITGGEVEDYQVNVAAPVPNGAACSTTGLLNGGFEAPVQGANSFLIQSQDLVPGWTTTATDSQIEIWSTPYQGVTAYEGNQFAEMNANQVASLYQDITTVPGSTITYQFAHRARSLGNPAVVVDTAGVQAGPPGQAGVTLKTFSDDSTAWVVQRGTYIVPAGQYITRFQFNSISAGAGAASVGNFIDGVQFSTDTCVTPILPPTIDLDGNNSTATGNDYLNTFTIGGSAVAAADTDTLITDEKTTITRAIFTLTNTPDGANESLTVDPTAGGTVSGVTVDLAYDSSGTSTNGRLTLKGTATLADYQKIIATLKYSNTKVSPTTTNRIINVQVIDSDKAISNTAVSTIKIASPVSVSGTVFSDADADVTINGSDTGTNTGSGTLTIYAINTAGNVINKATVGANGTYMLSNIPANASVTLRLSNNASVAVGATAPTTATIPSGWYFTGENKNGTTDGTIATLGNIALTTATSDITNQTFGIRQATVIAPDAAPATCTPDYRTQLNTGVSAVGGQLAAGTSDLNWTAEWIAGPASGIGTPYATPRPVGVMPAVVTGNLAPGAWINEPANARWISYPFRLSSNSNGNHKNADLDSNTGEDGSGNPIIGTSDAVRLKFTASLTLPSNANTISVSLPIGVAVDNQFTSIKVNGIENLSPVPTPNSQAAGFSSLQNINVTQGWQAGVNTIEITVDSGPPLAGFFLAINAASTQVCGPANVLLVKRITEIASDRAKNPNDPTFPLNQALNRPSFAADDPSPTNNWPSNFLVGAYDAGRIKPGDTVEYTVYFMNSSGADINNAKFCDRIVGNQTFVAGAYGGSGKDIEYKLGTNPVQYLTQASDTTIDRAYLNPSIGVIPGCPAPTISGTNHGSLVIDVTGTGSSGQVDLTALPGATTGTVTPNPSSYGYFRFKTIIDP